MIVIVSGGQTGADRGGLDAALQEGTPHGGWCPRRREAEDGQVPIQYILKEAAGGYLHRTRLNAEESDGTIIFTFGPNLYGGSLRTWWFAEEAERPVRWIDLSHAGDYVEPMIQFIEEESIQVLNVAGQRESKSPGIQVATRDLMVRVIQALRA